MGLPYNGLVEFHATMWLAARYSYGIFSDCLLEFFFGIVYNNTYCYNPKSKDVTGLDCNSETGPDWPDNTKNSYHFFKALTRLKRL